MNRTNISLKNHFILGLVVALWLFLFLVFVKPFQEDFVPLGHWSMISLGTSVITFICYVSIVYLQNGIYKHLKKWNNYYEAMLLILFNLLLLFTIFIFYKTDFTDGGYNLADFITIVFIPISIIFSPLIIFARKFVLKLANTGSHFIIIQGDNKLDFLKIKVDDLVCASNAQNYVEVFYLKNKQLKNKLIRTTLKKLQSDIPHLVKAHRSHLLNPQHIIDWKDASTVSLTQIDIAVSKNHKDSIHSYLIG